MAFIASWYWLGQDTTTALPSSNPCIPALFPPFPIGAGRVRDARALCRQCGQPWRSVSLGGGGGFGPLPVGLAAAQHDDELSPEQQAQVRGRPMSLAIGCRAGLCRRQFVYAHHQSTSLMHAAWAILAL